VALSSSISNTRMPIPFLAVLAQVGTPQGRPVKRLETN
jgi:hypothetical protein